MPKRQKMPRCKNSSLNSPASASIADGTNQQLTATGSYSDNSTQDLTTLATWSSSDPSTAAISNSAGSQGLATGVAAGGPVTIVATQGGVNGTAQLTITTVTQSVQGRLIFGSDYISGLYEMDASRANVFTLVPYNKFNGCNCRSAY